MSLRVSSLALSLISAGLIATRLNAQTVGAAKWSSPFATGGPVGGSPVISADGQAVYVTSKDGKLYAINAATGQQQWQAQLDNFASYGSEFISSPTVAANGTIYVASTDGNLYDINPDGSQNWALSIIAPSDFVGSSVAIGHDGTVYVTYDDISELVAVNPIGSNGKGSVAWILNLSEFSDSCPSIGPDGTIYFIDRVGNLDAVVHGSSDTFVEWTFNLGFYEDGDDFQFAPVVNSDGTVYVPYGVNADGLIAISSTGKPMWTFATQTGLPIQSSPAIGVDGTIYFGDANGTFYALNPDGNLKWKYALCSSGMGINSSPAIAADGTIYVGSVDGRLYAIKDNGANGSLQWTYPAAGQPSLTREILSSPLIGPNGAVYFGCDDDNVYAVQGSASLANSTWPMFRKDASHTASQALVSIPPTVDRSFDGGLSGIVSDITLQNDGKILVAGNDPNWTPFVYRLNSDGTPDPAFNASGIIGDDFVDVECVAVDSLHRVYVGGDGLEDASYETYAVFARLDSSGYLTTIGDGTDFLFTSDAASVVNTISGGGHEININGNTTLTIGGAFTYLDQFSQGELSPWYTGTNVADYLLTSGDSTSPDSWWPAVQITGGIVNCLEGLDGPTAGGGNLSSSLGDSGIIGIEGSPVPTFSGGVTWLVSCEERQEDGKLILGGESLVRFNVDGTPDTEFNNNVANISAVNTIFVQSDGKLLIGGNGLIRLNADGTSDKSFSIPLDGTVTKLVQQPDGKILIVGSFSIPNPGGQQEFTDIARIFLN